MNANWIGYIQKLKLQKKQRRRISAFITAVSVCVTGSVSWLLRSVGTAMTDDNITADTDELLALIADNSDFSEDRSLWDASLPDTTGLSLPDSIAAVAESQLGYEENPLNFIIDDVTGNKKYSSRYGIWYGNPYGEWNNMFTLFCLKFAGIDDSAIPSSSGCWAWTVELRKQELLIPSDRGSPKRGEVVFFDNDLDGQADCSAIITAVSGDEQSFTAIQGDLNGKVAEIEHDIRGDTIFGYFIPPETSPDIIEAPPDEESPAIAESTPDNDAEITPLPFEFEAVSASGITVRALADENAFPEGTVMTVSDVPREQALQAVENINDDALDAVAVDISFSGIDGAELEPSPDSSVQVSIILPDQLRLQGGELSLLHVDDNGSVQQVDADISQYGADFTAESFSIYVLTSNGNYVDKDEVITVNGESVANTAENPYILYVGDKIKVRGITTKDPNKSEGWLWGNEKSILNQIDGTEVTTQIGENRWTHDADYFAKSAGDTQINIDGGDAGGYSSFYIRVLERPQIYVNTANGEIQKDMVHAYLDNASNSNKINYTQIVYDEDGNPLYIKNELTNDGKYMLFMDQTVELVSYIPADVQPNASGKYYTTQNTASIEIVSESPETPVNGIRRVTAIIKATSESQNATVSINGENFYIWTTSNVNYAGQIRTGNHPDIEIADGGTYKSKIITYNDDGSVVETITVYDAYVSGVNQSTLYDQPDQSGNVLQNYVEYDYWCDPAFKPGDSQYEYTAAYGHEGQNKQPQSAKTFSLKSVKSARFDVSLLLSPKTQQIKTYQNNTLISDITTDISDQDDTTISSCIFNLDERYVIDAYNKCPDHSGLDFTLKADLLDNTAIFPITAIKLLNYDNTTAAPQKGNEFEFELLSVTDQKALKIAYDGQHNPGNIPVSDVFSDIQSDEQAIAYLFFDHTNFALTDAFDITGFNNDSTKFSSYNNSVLLGGLIDRLNNKTETTITPEEFYSTIAKYANSQRAILPSGDIFDLAAGHYLFQKLSVVATAKNDENGNIVFPAQIFASPGIYHYYIREKNTGNSNYIYDSSLKRVTVTVTQDTDGILTASVSYDGSSTKPQFTNTQNTYRLPDTGGSGTLPFFIIGSAFISGAFLLLVKSRRKEDI